MKKEYIIRAFDKANGYGEEFGDWADYQEIEPIRSEFIAILNAMYSIESKAMLSGLSSNAINLLDKEISKD